MDDIRLNGRGVAYQSINDIEPFPSAAREKVRAERDVGICDVVIGDASETPVPNVIFRQQILPRQFQLGPIGCGPLPGAPEARKDTLGIHVDDIPDGTLNQGGRDMASVGVREFMR